MRMLFLILIKWYMVGFCQKGHTFYRTADAFQQFTVSKRELLSQVDASSTKDDDDDDVMEVEDQLTECRWR